MKIALAVIVKGSDDEATLLDRCLSNIGPFVDSIFVTRTTVSGDTKNRRVAQVAKEHGAHLSDFEWIDDFAAARNFNFAQVPKEYDWVMWSDVDDVWRGLEKLRSTIEDASHADGFGFWYLYDWDEHKKPVVVHRKTMVIRNDGCAQWEGPIHEDLQPTRVLDVRLVEGIQRLHLSNEKRLKDNAHRNVRIAEKQVKINEIDPRNYWNLANAQFGVSDFKGAKKTFEKFIQESQSQEEIYIARTRLANVYKALGQREEALRELQTAIGLEPTIPDAYLQLASYYFEFGNLDKAEHYCLQGMIKRPQIMKMIVYNPRDYDYNPMMLLANIYEAKSRPDLSLPLIKGCLKIYPDDEKLKAFVKNVEKEKKVLAKALTLVQKLQKITDKKKLKAALEKVPEDLRSHPAIAVIRNTNFIKEKSSGRDLVIYCGNTVRAWNPELFKKEGFGGSEEAIVYLARELARLGWNVTVYNNCGHKEVIEKGDGLIPGEMYKVIYRPFWEWNYRDKQDAVILWRWAKPLDAEINAEKIFLDLHDVIPEGELTEKRLQRVTKVMVKTKFHRSLFPNTPSDKFAIIPNGVHFNTDDNIKRDPMLMINTSSPDRSLDVLPKLYKEIKKQVPHAKMQWAYGWGGFIDTYQNDQKKMQWMDDTKRAMEEAGIEDLGRLTQAEVGKLYRRATILAYPTEFAEIDCISVKKAQIAGCIPVTTDFGALDESVICGYKAHSSKTKDNWNRPYQFHFGLEDERAQKAWVELAVEALETRGKTARVSPGNISDWVATAKRWHDELCA